MNYTERFHNFEEYVKAGENLLLGENREMKSRYLLKASGRLRRIGSDKGGHWEVVREKEGSK